MSHWETGHPPTPARGKPMPQTVPYFRKLAAMDLDLILKQKAEIGTLKARVTRLTQKLNKKRRVK